MDDMWMGCLLMNVFKKITLNEASDALFSVCGGVVSLVGHLVETGLNRVRDAFPFWASYDMTTSDSLG